MITAQFASRCWCCGQSVRPGDLISRGATGKWCHASCAGASGAQDHRQKSGTSGTSVTVGCPVLMFADLPESLTSKAYRSLSRVLHPDAGGDLAQMQQLTEAYRKHKQDQDRHTTAA